MSGLVKREIHFANILDRVEALLLQDHPASKTVEAHLQALQSQWSWLLQLTLCLEVHLKHATDYHQFFNECKDAEAWLTKRDEILKTKYSQSEFGIDQGEATNTLTREALNTKFERLLEALSQRLKIAVEVNGANGEYSYFAFLFFLLTLLKLINKKQ